MGDMADRPVNLQFDPHGNAQLDARCGFGIDGTAAVRQWAMPSGIRKIRAFVISG